MAGEGAAGDVRDAAAACAIRLDAEGRIVELNDAAAQLFGCIRPEALGRPLAELAAAALARERLAAHEARSELDAFSHTVAHDLRAPLRHIEGFARMLEDETEGLNEDGRHYLEVITRASKRLALMIEDLLLHSRAARVEMHPGRIDMDALVAEVVRDKGAQAAGRTIVWDVAPMPAASADRNLVRQALGCLVDNALKFTKNQAQPRIAIGGAPAGSEVEYFVKDNGAGFDMKYASKLFGVFQRLHAESEFEGLGIGLALVQRIATRLGGRVRAEGEVGKGATVTFTLPAG